MREAVLRPFSDRLLVLLAALQAVMCTSHEYVAGVKDVGMAASVCHTRDMVSAPRRDSDLGPRSEFATFAVVDLYNAKAGAARCAH